jgi:hypothetical protein
LLTAKILSETTNNKAPETSKIFERAGIMVGVLIDTIAIKQMQMA